nr:unnamed protein product [Callosobruchus analis]
MADENRIKAFKNKGKDTERRNISIDEATSPLQESNKSSPISMTADEISYGMMSPDEDVQFRATQACRKILSRERNPPIDHMIRLGVVPRCVEFLGKAHNPALQFESCWALTNIASGTSEQTAAVVQEGAIPRLRMLLTSPRPDVVDQAVWALGNIAGDGPGTRDMVLRCGVLQDLLALIRPDSPVSLLRNAVWTISNLCRNKNPPPNFELVRPALPTLAKLLNYSDLDVLGDTCWALSYLTDGSNDKIQEVIDTGLVPRAVGNIVTGNDHQTDVVINAGVLNVMPKLLQHSRLNIVKEAAWTISNITAGNSEQIQKVIDAGIMAPLLIVLQTGDFKSQKEAAWAVTNYTSGGTIAQLARLVEMGALKPMCNLLNSKDQKTVAVILDGLANILNAANKMGEVEKVAILIEECGGLDGIEALQNHDNEKIYEKALSIIENYFSEPAVDENVPGPQTADGQLQFASPTEVPNGGFSF